MHFRQLEETDITNLNTSFNKAFEGYFVDMQMDEDAFRNRFIEKERISFKHSGAWFDEQDQMVAFIMHSIGYDTDDTKVAYNAGTGVIPEYRGKNLSTKLYENILPFLKEDKVQKIILEVITENYGAIKSYEKLNFKNIRELEFYGVNQLKPIVSDIEVVSVNWISDLDFENYNDWSPSWPLKIFNLKRIKDKLSCFSVFDDKKHIGYTIANLNTGRIHYYGVHKSYRRQGVGSALINKVISESKKDITLLNIDKEDTASSAMFNKLGLEVKISQYEMIYTF